MIDQKKPLVSVIIPTSNRAAMLAECLTSVFNSTYTNIEVIVVDDNSQDSTQDLLTTYGDRLKSFKNDSTQRLIKTRNRGGHAATGEYLLFADDDNIFERQMIELLVQSLNNDSSIGVCGPMMYYFSNKDLIWWSETEISRYSARTFFPHRNESRGCIIDETKETDGIPNLFMVRRDAFLAVNGFDESYFNTWTEADFCERVKSSGYRIVRIKRAETYHQVDPSDWNGRLTARSIGDNPAKAYTTVRNRYKFVGKYFSVWGKISFILFFSWLLFGYYVLCAFKLGKKEYIPFYFRGLFDGLRMFFGSR